MIIFWWNFHNCKVLSVYRSQESLSNAAMSPWRRMYSYWSANGTIPVPLQSRLPRSAVPMSVLQYASQNAVEHFYARPQTNWYSTLESIAVYYWCQLLSVDLIVVKFTQIIVCFQIASLLPKRINWCISLVANPCQINLTKTMINIYMPEPDFLKSVMIFIVSLKVL